MSRTRTALRTLVEILIIFVASLGVIGLIQDYFWYSQPTLVTADKIQLKYVAAGMVTLAHLLVVVRRRTRPR